MMVHLSSFYTPKRYWLHSSKDTIQDHHLRSSIFFSLEFRPSFIQKVLKHCKTISLWGGTQILLNTRRSIHLDLLPPRPQQLIWVTIINIKRRGRLPFETSRASMNSFMECSSSKGHWLLGGPRRRRDGAVVWEGRPSIYQPTYTRRRRTKYFIFIKEKRYDHVQQRNLRSDRAKTTRTILTTIFIPWWWWIQ